MAYSAVQLTTTDAVGEAFSPDLTCEFSTLRCTPEPGDALFEFTPVSADEANRIGCAGRPK
jgi:hypothetical protein